MVGNGPGDVEAGSRAGCRTILLDSRGHEQKIQPGQVAPDYRAVNLKEVVNIVKMQARSQPKQTIAAISIVEPDQQPVAEPQPVVEPQPAPQQQPLTLQQDQALQQAVPEQTGEQKIDEELTTQQLLTGILDQLKAMRRTNLYGEFFINRFVAGVIQGIVFLCLLASIYFLMSPAGQLNSVLIALGFAILLQLMALTFYLMQGPK
jgi:hypothetical protein